MASARWQSIDDSIKNYNVYPRQYFIGFETRGFGKDPSTAFELSMNNVNSDSCAADWSAYGMSGNTEEKVPVPASMINTGDGKTADVPTPTKLRTRATAATLSGEDPNRDLYKFTFQFLKGDTDVYPWPLPKRNKDKTAAPFIPIAPVGDSAYQDRKEKNFQSIPRDNWLPMVILAAIGVLLLILILIFILLAIFIIAAKKKQHEEEEDIEVPPQEDESLENSGETVGVSDVDVDNDDNDVEMQTTDMPTAEGMDLPSVEDSGETVDVSAEDIEVSEKIQS